MNTGNRVLGKRVTAAVIAAIAVGLVVASGCMSRQTGKSGNLEFAYAADDDLVDFNKPIAVGAKLDLLVSEAGTHKRVELESAETDDPAILAVDGFNGRTITLEGKSEGISTVNVGAEVPDGSVVEDSIDMSVAVPTVLKMRHYCTSEATGYYLAGQEVWVPFDMELDNGRAVVGYGYFPVDIEPADSAQLDQTTKDQAHLRLTLPSDKQTITLNSTIDDASLELELQEPGDIDGIELVTENPRVDKGKTGLVYFLPTVGGKPVCQARTSIEAQSETPDICDVSAAEQPEDSQHGANEWGWVSVQGKDGGTCEFTVTYSDANGGAGVSETFSADIYSAE